jgi:hypothetical protein
MTARFLLSISIAAASAICAGCATNAAGREPDWYAIGANEGRLGVHAQDDYYESRFSTPAARALYLRGWENGIAQRPAQVW